MTRVAPRARCRSNRRSKNRRRVDAVEIAGGLVGENERRIVDDAARDGHALTLTAGQFLRQMRGAVGETDRLERFLDPAPPLARCRRSEPNIATSTFSLAVSVGNRLNS